MRMLLSVALAVLAPTVVSAQAEADWREMNQPREPFRIAGNLYSVGASSVTSFLITTDEGHILIDGGFVETAPMIVDNLAAVGFSIDDVAVLLNSHAHFDHAGGLARLRELSGARVVASRRDAPLLERGGLGDPFLGDDGPFPPVSVDEIVDHGDTIEVGGVTLTALVTPGHTQGCTSWSFDVKVDDTIRRAVSICSLSILSGMRLVDDPTWPGIADDFRLAFERLESSGAEIFIASHAGFFQQSAKRSRLGESPNPFVDPDGFRMYVEKAREKFEAVVAQETEKGTTQ